jgi:hypothetical protein
MGRGVVPAVEVVAVAVVYVVGIDVADSAERLEHHLDGLPRGQVIAGQRGCTTFEEQWH